MLTYRQIDFKSLTVAQMNHALIAADAFIPNHGNDYNFIRAGNGEQVVASNRAGASPADLHNAKAVFRDALGEITRSSAADRDADADARLIAAAPEMLVLLVEVRDWVLQANDEGDEPWIDRADAVIAAATGQ